MEFIKNEDYKYVRMLGAFYLRLVGKPLDVYQYLEARASPASRALRLRAWHARTSTLTPRHAAQPLYNDYRRVRRRAVDGRYTLMHVDQFIEELLTQV